jgi:hypothetical protein
MKTSFDDAAPRAAALSCPLCTHGPFATSFRASFFFFNKKLFKKIQISKK